MNLLEWSMVIGRSACVLVAFGLVPVLFYRFVKDKR